MPPPRPRILFPSYKPSRCNQLHPLKRQPFSTSSRKHALGPESPNYISVPKPIQPTSPPKPIIKGVLPIPRNIFRTRSAHPKASTPFLSAATQEPTSQRRISPYQREADRLEYKRRLAETRRQALRSGITGLHERKVDTETKMFERRARLSAEHIALVNAPERDSDRLTNPSVSKSIRDFMANKLVPSSRTTLAQRRQRYSSLQARKGRDRKDQLHTLYVNARDFIVEEKQLDEAIEKAFGDEESPVGWHVDGTMEPGARGQSVWVGGTPEGVRDLLERSLSGANGDKKSGDGGYSVARERMKRIAEGLTGGKM